MSVIKNFVNRLFSGGGGTPPVVTSVPSKTQGSPVPETGSDEPEIILEPSDRFPILAGLSNPIPATLDTAIEEHVNSIMPSYISSLRSSDANEHASANLLLLDTSALSQRADAHGIAQSEVLKAILIKRGVYFEKNGGMDLMKNYPNLYEGLTEEEEASIGDARLDALESLFEAENPHDKLEISEGTAPNPKSIAEAQLGLFLAFNEFRERERLNDQQKLIAMKYLGNLIVG